MDPVTALPDGLELIRPLGEGTVARVYLAREPELERVVAVKILRRELVTDETARLRFEREARSAASLAHPNVVPIHRFGRLGDGTPYLVMAHVSGRTLEDRIHADGPMAESEARALLSQLASALSAAHRKSIVHRDVRPGNVLMDGESGRFMLSDFGIAALLEDGGGANQRLTRTGQIIGEPRYSSPEQLRGEKVTPQADVYSLAIVIYEALTGEGPYRTRSKADVFAAHLTGEPRRISRIRPGISAELEDLLVRCLAKPPSHRPTAEDILKRLGGEPGRTAAGGASVLAPASYPGLDLMRRRIPQIVLSTVVGGVALIGFAWTLEDSGRVGPWMMDHAINLAIWALLGSIVLAWFHGERGAQEVPTIEKWILAMVAGGYLAVTVVMIVR